MGMTAGAQTRSSGRGPGFVGTGVPVAYIGPNAIIQLAAAIDRLHGHQVMRDVFDAADQARHLDRPPARMVDELDVVALHRAGRALMGVADFTAAAALAGSLTGDYVLQHRIPAAARTLLPRLPDFVASRVLARAIARHAWTFAGSGRFAYRFGPQGLVLTIRNPPLARSFRSPVPGCHYYAATFERIFRELVNGRAQVSETDCASTGTAACRFLIRWPG
jgi:divinyl protochlorophyllide a 8-vinyl-reductase